MKTIAFSTSQTTSTMVEVLRAGDNYPQFNVTGILDDDPNKQGNKFYGLQVIGTFRDVVDMANRGQATHFLIGLAAVKHMKIKAALYDFCRHIGLHPLNVVSKHADISPTAHIEDGMFIGSMTFIGSNCSIGPNCSIHAGVKIMENCTLESNVMTAGNSFIGGLCKIKSNVYVGPGVIVGSETTIGENSVLGAGSVVLTSVPPNTFIRGNPPAYVPMRRHAFYLPPPMWMQGPTC